MLKRTAQAFISGSLVLGTVTAMGTTGAAAATGPSSPTVSEAVTAPGRAEPVRVRTDKGVVRGRVAEDARTFQGIPYAAPPTGPGRWAPPAPARRWDGVRDATEPGSACPQTGSIGPLGPHSETEDCLFVNVTTPRTAAARPRPVMVYLHGGDHTDGEGAMHGANRLASRGDVVVVTVNYRLGALGYLAHPELEKNGESGNYGFLDQQAALRWVQRNATAFGGDPDNVTLFGQSAGGYSACAHMAAPSSAGLFDRVILQSAACTTPTDGRRDREDALAQGATAVAEIEENGAEDWRTALPGQLVHPFGTGPAYAPSYGGALLPRTPAEAFATGRFNQVPVLQGINRQEDAAGVYNLEAIKRAQTGDPDARLDAADCRAHLEDEFGSEKAGAIADRYPVEDYGDSPARALAAALTDGHWAQYSVESGRALSRHVRTYSYEFADEEVPWYTDPVYAKPGFLMGAAHTFELPYLFELDDFEPLTRAQRGLSDKMIGIWTDFARTGEAAWEPTTPASPNVRSLASGPGGVHGVDFAEEHHYGFWKSLR
ncbi:carboxylesterase/lipase family protein [Streptomyces nitrosporeus]|uniref:carboxylesterase/lipase family protein n=1 Tax=Streptomyces nitrosporeus TaxID=28894 RepID=UPI0039A1F3E4